jgi:hypothetical protein
VSGGPEHGLDRVAIVEARPYVGPQFDSRRLGRMLRPVRTGLAHRLVGSAAEDTRFAGDPRAGETRG